MDKEIWKSVRGYEGLYEVSNLGRVKSLYDGNHKRFRERILRPGKARGEYLFVILVKEGEHKMYKVHRLVLSAFSPVENSHELQVNHLNECKTDNRLENLEWCTCKENINHGTRNKRAGEKLRGRTLSEEHKIKLSIPIVQIDPSTDKVVNVWGSSIAVERECGFDNGSINKCCKGKLKTHKGYKWQYLHVYMHNIDPRIKKVILFGKEYDF